MKVGIIGTGGVANLHAEAIKASGNELLAVSDADVDRAKSFAAKWNTRACASIDELLKQDVDLVTIGTPNRFHFDLSARALKAGRAVLCEKPMTTSASQSRQLVEIAKETRKPLFVGYMNRAHPEVQRFQRAAQSIGPIRTGIVRIHLPCELKVWDGIAESLRKDPTDPRYENGMLAMVASHFLDLLLWAAGPVKRVVGARLQIRRGCAPMDSDVHALLEMENGASVLLDCAFPALSGLGPREHGWDKMIEVRGDAGLARVITSDTKEQEPVAECWDKKRKTWEAAAPLGINFYTREFEYLALALRGENVPLARGEDGLRVDELVEKIAQAGK